MSARWQFDSVIGDGAGGFLFRGAPQSNPQTWKSTEKISMAPAQG